MQQPHWPMAFQVIPHAVLETMDRDDNWTFTSSFITLERLHTQHSVSDDQGQAGESDA
jgi:hypothetical protein